LSICLIITKAQNVKSGENETKCWNWLKTYSAYAGNYKLCTNVQQGLVELVPPHSAG